MGRVLTPHDSGRLADGRRRGRVHETPNAGPRRRLEDVSRPFHVGPNERRRVAQAGGVQPGRVEDHLAPSDRSEDGVGFGHVTESRARARIREHAGARVGA